MRLHILHAVDTTLLAQCNTYMLLTCVQNIHAVDTSPAYTPSTLNALIYKDDLKGRWTSKRLFVVGCSAVAPVYTHYVRAATYSCTLTMDVSCPRTNVPNIHTQHTLAMTNSMHRLYIAFCSIYLSTMACAPLKIMTQFCRHPITNNCVLVPTTISPPQPARLISL